MDEKKAAPAGEGPGREEMALARMAEELRELLDRDFTRAEPGRPLFELRQTGRSEEAYIDLSPIASSFAAKPGQVTVGENTKIVVSKGTLFPRPYPTTGPGGGQDRKEEHHGGEHL